MKVLAVASEAFPLVKTGGLADVVGALPAALAAEGVDVTTLLPGYPAVMQAVAETRRMLPGFFGGDARIMAGKLGGQKLLALDAPHLFARPGNPYLGPGGAEWEDNGYRFAALAAAAALLARDGFDAVHAHDWQAGLTGAYLRHTPGPRVPLVFTIHNLAFQGQFPAALFPHLGLPGDAMRTDGLEYFGGLGYLKAGIWYADRVTTVSPTYAAEIRTPEGGMGLDGLLRGRGGDVSGILNGLDVAEWDPAQDVHLAERFDAGTLDRRAANKAALQARLGMVPDPAAPVFAFVGRLAWQKGIDLVLEALPAISAAGGQLAILGTGDAGLGSRCGGAALASGGRVGFFRGFDEALARLTYGGADILLAPSRFEPCGLVQLCALRYGAPPLVARTGGLADTVIDANDMALAAGCATGLHFAPVTVDMLAVAIHRAAELYRDAETWRRMQRNAMACDVSWSRSAARYARLFRAAANA